jgi:sugar phosphate isomerase/epimerase
MRETVAEHLKRICETAAMADCGVSLEFHGGTLTDTAESTTRLMDAVGAPNLTTYWQPPTGMGVAECKRSLEAVLPRLGNVHVFHWWPDDRHRLPLAQGADRWREYLAVAAKAGGQRHASLEFVRGDDVEQLRNDAKTFHNLLEEKV